MREEKNTKNRKWLWPVIVVAAVLVIAGTLLGIFWSDIFGGNAGAMQVSDLYWNLDRLTFVDPDTGMSTRVKGDDGYFHIRFVYNGEIVEKKVIGDKKLVNYIETLDVMGLIMDANGVVLDVAEPKTFKTEIAKSFYVRDASQAFLRLNANKAMNGGLLTVALNDGIGIYDVSTEATNVGEKTTCRPMDCVTIYGDENGNVTHIFVTARAVEAELYYRVESAKYDKTTLTTKREPNEDGIYILRYAYEGEQVEVKCRDKAVVTEMDKAESLVGLLFDEEGYVIRVIPAASAMVGILEGQRFTVDSVDGENFFCTKYFAGSEQGATYEGVLTEETDIFVIAPDCGYFIGERTELQVGDRITIYTDLKGNARVLLVDNRRVPGPLYWNVSRSYANGETSRKPNADGYYEIELFAEGKIKTYRTKDKALMTAMDKFEERAFGLTVKGDIVQAVYRAQCVTGLYAAGIDRYVTAISSMVIQVTNPNSGDVANVFVSKDAAIYDMSNLPGTKYGQSTKVRIGDKVTCFQNESCEIIAVYITSRYLSGSKLYYRMDQKFKTDENGQNVTARVPDAEGYYVYQTACEGKVVNIKTKNKAYADYIDTVWPQIVAATVDKNGVIQELGPGTAAYKSSNYRAADTYIGSIEGSKVITYMADGRMSNNLVLASDYQAWSVNNYYVKNFGEKTTAQVGDRIITIMDSGQVVQVFVIGRQLDSPVYWNYKRQYANGATTRTPNADGYYVIDLIADGKVVQVKTKDKDMASKIDAETGGFALVLKNGVVQYKYPPNIAKNVQYYGVGAYDTMEIKDGTITAVRNRPQASDFGAKSTFKIAKGCKIIDVDPNSPTFTKITELKLGDRITTYRNPASEASYIFITNRHTREAGHVSYCEHCGQEVWWEHFIGDFITGMDYHYYLPYDRSVGGYAYGSNDASVPDGELILDLNGNSWKSSGAITVRDKMTILDSKGGGKITSSDPLNVNAGSVNVTGQLRIISGDILRVATNNTNAKIIVEGKPTVRNMKILPGVKIELGELKQGASITVDALDAFTEVNAKAADYAKYFFAIDEDMSITAVEGVLYCSQPDPEIPDVPDYTAKLTNKNKVIKAYCPACDTIKIWNPVQQSDLVSMSKLGATDNHFYLTENMVGNESRHADGILVTEGIGSACLHLNGYNITNEKGRALLVTKETDTLNVMGSGTVSGKANAFGVTIYNKGVLNLYAGNYTSVAAGTGNYADMILSYYKTKLSIYADVTIDNGANQNAAVGASMAPELNLYGAKINGEVKLGDTTATTLSGAAKIQKLTIPEGNMITLKDLAAEARIAVAGVGAFTVANENAAQYVNCFTAASDKKQINLGTDNIFCCDDKPVEAPAGVTYTSKLTEQTGVVEAYCMACKGYRNWTPVNKSSMSTMTALGSQDKHFYLTEDLVGGESKHADGVLCTAGIGKACVHLNGFNITNTNGRAFLVTNATDTLNILGSGTVSGKGTFGGVIYAKGGLNLYGGTYVNRSDITTGDNRGTLLVYSTGNVNVYEGATVESTVASIPAIDARGILNINSATVKGEIKLAAASSAALTLSGAPDINNLYIPSGKKITLGELTSGADITVQASGVFTQTNPNAAAYAEYFNTTSPETKEIQSDNNELSVVQKATPPVGVQTNYTEKLQFVGNTNRAWCAVCKAEVEWKPVNADIHNMNNWNVGDHFYLTQSINSTYSADALFYTGGRSLCLHLNGFDITCTGNKAIYVSGSGDVLNILGTGVVSGKGNSFGVTVYNKGRLNLYAGTYRKVASGTGDFANLIMSNTGSTLSIYDDAIIDNGSDPVHAIDATRATALNIFGCTIIGEVKTGTNTAVTVSRAAKVSKLTLAPNALLAVGQMAQGAEVVMNVDGPFSVVDENAATNLGYFKAFDSTKEVKVQGGQLAVVAKAAPPAESQISYTDDLQFQAGTTKAWCAVCRAEKTWTAWDGTAMLYPQPGLHYYLADHVNAGSKYVYMSGAGSACLHLNGKNLTTSGIALNTDGANAVLNVLGSGKVTGNGTYGATAYVRYGTLKLYSGIYEKANDASRANTTSLLMVANGSSLYLYKDVTVNNHDSKVAIYSNAAGDRYFIDGATVNGTVSGTSGATVTLSGAPKIACLNMKSGNKLVVGELTEGASIGLTDFVTKNDLTFSNAPVAYAPYFHAVTEGDAIIAAANGTVTYASGKIKWINETSGTAICPVCGVEEIWYKLGNGVSSTLTNVSSRTHFAVTTNLNKTNNPDAVVATAGNKAFCLHLNGHDMTNTSSATARAIMISNAGDTLNIMGKGNVYGSGTFGGVIYNKGVLNLYGGTYHKNVAQTVSDSNLLLIYNNAKASVYPGAKLVNGTSIVPSISATRSGAQLAIYGGVIEGEVKLGTTSVVTLSGAPQIGKLTIPANLKVTLGSLQAGAQITVSATGAFTNAHTNAVAYKDYFIAAATNDTIVLQENDSVLAYQVA